MRCEPTAESAEQAVASRFIRGRGESGRGNESGVGGGASGVAGCRSTRLGGGVRTSDLVVLGLESVIIITRRYGLAVSRDVDKTELTLDALSREV